MPSIRNMTEVVEELLKNVLCSFLGTISLPTSKPVEDSRQHKSVKGLLCRPSQQKGSHQAKDTEKRRRVDVRRHHFLWIRRPQHFLFSPAHRQARGALNGFRSLPFPIVHARAESLKAAARQPLLDFGPIAYSALRETGSQATGRPPPSR